MKPSKKQNNLNSKKNKGNKNEPSAPLIQSFFKAAPKSFVVDKTKVLAEPKNDDRQFYVDLLKSKLESKFLVQFFVNVIQFFIIAEQLFKTLPPFDFIFCFFYTKRFS